MKRQRAIHGNGAKALQPSYFTEQPSEADLLRVEIAQLRQRVADQSHAIKQLNHTIRFVVRTLGQPLIPHTPGRRIR